MESCALSKLNPFVRYVRRLHIGAHDFPSFIVPCDCRLFYVERGAGSIQFENQTVALEHGVLVIWQSGEYYRMASSNASEPVVLLAVNFDLTDEYAALSMPIPFRRLRNLSAGSILRAPDCPELGLSAAPLVLREALFAEPMLKDMLYEYELHMRFYGEYTSSLMRQLLALAARRMARVGTEFKLQPVLDYLHLHYAEPLTNAMLGEKFGFHPNALSRLMLRHTGQTLHQYLLNYRLRRAVALIETGGMSIKQICGEVGIPDQGYFSKLFKLKIGRAPSDYMCGRS